MDNINFVLRPHEIITKQKLKWKYDASLGYTYYSITTQIYHFAVKEKNQGYNQLIKINYLRGHTLFRVIKTRPRSITKALLTVIVKSRFK